VLSQVQQQTAGKQRHSPKKAPVAESACWCLGCRWLSRRCQSSAGSSREIGRCRNWQRRWVSRQPSAGAAAAASWQARRPAGQPASRHHSCIFLDKIGSALVCIALCTAAATGRSCFVTFRMLGNKDIADAALPWALFFALHCTSWRAVRWRALVCRLASYRRCRPVATQYAC
jgi:hypothetical protein